MNFKRIAVISYHTCPLSDEKDAEIGGMNVYVLELSKELAKKGYIIDIFTRSADSNSEEMVNVAPNLRVIHIHAGKQVKISKKILSKYIPEFVSNIFDFILKEKINYDLISCHYYLSGLIGLEIKRKLNKPLTITFHTLALMKNLVARGEEEKEDIERIKAELLLTQKADKVISTSNSDADYIHTLYNCPPSKITVLTPGVDHDVFKPLNKTQAKKHIHADPDHKLILFVGRIEPLKAIDVLLYAIKVLQEKEPALQICLWIVGGKTSGRVEQWSSELQRLEQIRKILNITTVVKFVGMKQQNELPYYYNAAEVVIMPSHYESFGITALEAMACGIPVITTDVAGISTLFDKKHEFLLTSASNPRLLAQKIRNLITNKETYHNLSLEVFRKVQDLSWKKLADKYVKILNDDEQILHKVENVLENK